MPAVGHVDDGAVEFCSQSCVKEVSPLNMPVTVPSCATVGVGKDVSRLSVMFSVLRLESPLNVFAERDAIWLLPNSSFLRFESPLNIFASSDVIWLRLIQSSPSIDIPLNMFASSDVIWLRLMDRLIRFTILPLNIFAGREVISLPSMSMLDKLVRYLVGVCV